MYYNAPFSCANFPKWARRPQKRGASWARCVVRFVIRCDSICSGAKRQCIATSCVSFPIRERASSRTSFPPLGLEYVAAALRPYAEQIELINFRHERTPSTQPLLKPETDLVCYSINWGENLELIRDDINALPPGVLTILGGRTATENPRYWIEALPQCGCRGLRRR